MASGRKSELYGFVDSLRQRYGITYSVYPLDTVAIAQELDSIDVISHVFECPSFCASALVGEQRDTIILNAQRTLSRNFDCAHELIHLKKHRDKGRTVFSCLESGRAVPGLDPFLEWEANEGAAELLVPYRLFLPYFVDWWPMINSRQDFLRFLSRAAKHFGVSSATIKVRFESLKHELWQFDSGVPLDEIELLSATQQRALSIQHASINDVYKKR